MKNDKTKRYLVTYIDPKTDSSKAMSLLEVSKENVYEGVSYLSKHSSPHKEHVLHFKNLGISSIELNVNEAATLSHKKGILAVEEDKEMHILGFPSKNISKKDIVSVLATQMWNMDLVKAPAAWGRGINGGGVKLAILDTGVAVHPDLVISGGISFVPNVPSYNDGNGHGTHCAGIATGRGIVAPNGFQIFGVAPRCDLYAVKVLADSGSGQSSWIISGMDWCITNGIKVASLSLGSSSAPSVAWATAVKRCQDAGVVVVCASGNCYQPVITPSCPIIFPWVGAPANSFIVATSNESPVAIGAIDQNSLIAPFSSRGGQTANWNLVTVVAPGVSIYSTYLNNGYATMSGTSMACPHAAGFAALLCQKYPGISPHLIMAKMSSTARNLGTGPFPNTPYGYGLINCDAATQ